MGLYLIANGAMPTTSAFVKVTTGTAIKTMLQVATSATQGMKVVEWGISFDGSAVGTPIEVELLDTGTVFGTVTASALADIMALDGDALNNGNVTTNLIQIGTGLTGYTCTSEGSITSVREFDVQLIAPTNQYVKQFPLGCRPFIKAGECLRIRVTAGSAVNAYCYVIVEI